MLSGTTKIQRVVCCLSKGHSLQSYRHNFCKTFHTTGWVQDKGPESNLMKQLKTRIHLSGPLTVADYMREVLTNPIDGYYMHRDVFGAKGDFITSPEISQMFGELIGIWCVNEWLNIGSPSNIQIVELGPGRGTLAADMMKVFSQFEGIKDAVSMHLVEVSPKLSQMQQEKLTGISKNTNNSTETGQPSDSNDLKTDINASVDSDYYQTCTSQYGSPIYWYTQLPDVPRKLSFYIAHEFFDALPIHKFQRKDGRWCEVLVDIDDSPTSDDHLRFVLAPGDTPASTLLKDAITENDKRDHIEVCPEGGILAQEIANRVSIDGGFGLIADYGHSADKTDTFRAFKQHKLHNTLTEPGQADLTADVDFTYLKKVIGNRLCLHGPVTQEHFLHNMGIGVRLEVLFGKATPEQRKDLITGYDMLTNPTKMGERFKFMALLRERPDNYIPAGFMKPGENPT